MENLNGPFETERLVLRRAKQEDRAELIRLNADPEVMRFIGADGIALEPGSDGSEAVVDRHMMLGSREDGLGIWILEWRHQAEFLGWVALMELPDTDLIEIGYRLKKAAWGQRIALEAAVFIINHGLETLRLPRIVAVTYPENTRSRAVLQNAGLSYLGIRKAYGIDTAYYEICKN